MDNNFCSEHVTRPFIKHVPIAKKKVDLRLCCGLDVEIFGRKWIEGSKLCLRTKNTKQSL